MNDKIKDAHAYRVSGISGRTVGAAYKRMRSNTTPRSEHRPLRAKNQVSPSSKALRFPSGKFRPMDATVGITEHTLRIFKRALKSI